MGHAAHNVERAVTRGVARRSLEGLRLPCTRGDAGLDEKSFGKGHDYVSVLHDLEGRRVLEVVPERTREATDTLWTAIPEPQRLGLSAVAMDMWVRGGPQPLDRISRSLSGLSAGLVKRLDPRTLCKPATVSADPVLDDVSHYCRNESI